MYKKAACWLAGLHCFYRRLLISLPIKMLTNTTVCMRESVKFGIVCCFFAKNFTPLCCIKMKAWHQTMFLLK